MVAFNATGVNHTYQNLTMNLSSSGLDQAIVQTLIYFMDHDLSVCHKLNHFIQNLNLLVRINLTRFFHVSFFFH